MRIIKEEKAQGSGKYNYSHDVQGPNEFVEDQHIYSFIPDTGQSLTSLKEDAIEASRREDERIHGESLQRRNSLTERFSSVPTPDLEPSYDLEAIARHMRDAGPNPDKPV